MSMARVAQSTESWVEAASGVLQAPCRGLQATSPPGGRGLTVKGLVQGLMTQ